MAKSPSFTPLGSEPRAFFVDPWDQSVTIKKIAQVERHATHSRYWRFELPRLERTKTARDSWDLFMSADGTQITPMSQWDASPDGLFFGRLDLQRLGVKHRIWRIHGVLVMVYVVKPFDTAATE